MRARLNPLWRFSSIVYARPRVREACLALQEDGGADVNLLLAAGWLARVAQREVRTGDFAACEAAVRCWRARAIERLRRLRRGFDAAAAPFRAPSAERTPRPDATPGRGEIVEAASALRSAILAAELDAEYIEQALILRVLAERGLVPPDAAADAFQDEVPRETCLEAARRNLAGYCGLLGLRVDAAVEDRLELIAAACCALP